MLRFISNDTTIFFTQWWLTLSLISISTFIQYNLAPTSELSNSNIKFCKPPCYQQEFWCLKDFRSHVIGSLEFWSSCHLLSTVGRMLLSPHYTTTSYSTSTCYAMSTFWEEAKFLHVALNSFPPDCIRE